MMYTGRFICFIYTALLINLIADINGQNLNRIGPQGPVGDPGIKGDQGERGEKGDVGPFAHDEDDEYDEDGGDGETGVEIPKKTIINGSKEKPAISCPDVDLSVLNPKKVYIYQTDPFPVHCASSKTCILKEGIEFKDEMGYKFQKKPFWLSTAGFNVKDFYGVERISQIKYLMRITSYTAQEIVVYCKNFEISNDPAKYLQIHLWDGQNIGPVPTARSPFFYELPEESNKCKNFANETEWKTAIIKLRVPLTFIKDFYVRDVNEGKEQAIYIGFKEFCGHM